MSAELLDKGAQLQNALREADKYRGLYDQRETEMAQMRDVIEDLEDKNRKLVDKLNQ